MRRFLLSLVAAVALAVPSTASAAHWHHGHGCGPAPYHAYYGAPYRVYSRSYYGPGVFAPAYPVYPGVGFGYSSPGFSFYYNQ